MAAIDVVRMLHNEGEAYDFEMHLLFAGMSIAALPKFVSVKIADAK
jgi:hypothetical protein